MKKSVNLGATTWRNMRGNAILEITDFSSNDPAYQKVPTIGEYKRLSGSMKAQLRQPFNNQPFLLDLGPWSQLPDGTHLHLSWKFIPEHLVSH